MSRLIAPLTIVIAAAGFAAAPAAAEERRLDGRATLEPGQEVHIDFPVGELDIEGVAGSELTIEVVGRCKRHSRRCDERLEEIEIDIRQGRSGLWIEVVPHSKWRWWDKLEIDARVRHPANHPLVVDMGVGELDVEGTVADLEIDLGVGEASVDVGVETVGSVYVDAGIGDTELRVPDGWVHGERSFLIGSESSWRDGPGDSRIHVDVGVGEAVVRLDG